ncbi:uncharacterized protein LOC133134059 isoform X2 [Conger conger]|uniref:uncharacterized protein LOC133134059 isoform X2 n=1 Tax=Conger conger TaxID=82655 RepID=UPI002A5B02F1|nr:uncharacterized protein LOC133134059 isoform X2 [Conger conger]
MRRFLRFCFSSVLGKKRLNMKYLLEQPELDRLFEKYVPKCIDTIVDGVVDGKQEKLKTIVPQTDLNMEETGVPGGNPRRHGENMQTPHREAPADGDSNPGPPC